MARQPRDPRQTEFVNLGVPPPRRKAIKQRDYPFWTENKALLIKRYLYYFVMITRHGTYIDAFAGPQERDRPKMWSARLVLESEPRWIKHFHLFEKNRASVRALRILADRQSSLKPKREIEVHPGDCNAELPRFLGGKPIRDTEATFCLLDQRTFECDWSTVQALAAYKRNGHKVELFYFFANGWLNRAIAASRSKGNERIMSWWGRPDWRDLSALKPHERAGLVAERFKNELGYADARPWPIYDKNRGRIMYYMIHASDHPEATNLMARAYSKAAIPKETRSQFVLAGVIK